MTLFWSKRTEPGKLIYARSKKQKRTAYLLMALGWLLFIGVPTLARNVSLPDSEFLSVILLLLIASGCFLIIFTAIAASMVNWKLAAAKRKGKKCEIISTREGDVVTIEA